MGVFGPSKAAVKPFQGVNQGLNLFSTHDYLRKNDTIPTAKSIIMSQVKA